MDEILHNSVEESMVEKNVPAGYYKIDMSTKGKYGAPKNFHVRNFSVEETLNLGMSSQEELPIKVIDMLQNLVWEEDVKIADFFEQEMSEFLIKFYITFYQHSLKDLDYEPTEEDFEYAAKILFPGRDSQEFKGWERAVKNKQIPLHFDIDLTKVKYYKIDENAPAKKKIKYTKGDFECVFEYPRFGDVAVVQKIIKDKFREKDRKFGPLYEDYKRNQEIDTALKEGKNVDPKAKVFINAEDMDAVRAYEIEKTTYIISLMKGMYIHSINGQVVRDLPLDERVELAKDPRIDYPAYQMVSDAFKDLEIGPVGTVNINNPITGGRADIAYTFRPLNLLAQIRNYKTDRASIEFV